MKTIDSIVMQTSNLKSNTVISKPKGFFSKLADTKLSELKFLLDLPLPIAFMIFSGTVGYFLSYWLWQYYAGASIFIPLMTSFAMSLLFLIYEVQNKAWKFVFATLLFVSLPMTVTSLVRYGTMGKMRYKHQVTLYDEANLKDKNFFILLDRTKVDNNNYDNLNLIMEKDTARTNFNDTQLKWQWSNGLICFETGCYSVNSENGNLTNQDTYFGKITNLEITPEDNKELIKTPDMDQTYRKIFKKNQTEFSYFEF
jgi:hypothetical protein